MLIVVCCQISSLLVLLLSTFTAFVPLLLSTDNASRTRPTLSIIGGSLFQCLMPCVGVGERRFVCQKYFYRTTSIVSLLPVHHNIIPSIFDPT